MCSEHEDEKINIYCLSCSVPTCSLCKVFGSHRSCQVEPLDTVFTTQKAELSDCVSMLVGHTERTQAIISQLEETCRAVDENGRRHKSQVCESFDHLFALLEERKGELTLKISCEQEEKLDYIRSLRRRYTQHLESTAKLLETAIQTLDEAEMAVFLQASKPLLQKIMEGTNVSHLEKIQHGYEKMDHFTANFDLQRKTLMKVDFVKGDEDGQDEATKARGSEVRGSEVRGSTGGIEQQATGLSTNQAPPQLPAQLSDPPPQNPPEAPPTATLPARSPAPASTIMAPPPPPVPSPAPQVQPEAEDPEGPRHVFSFSWLNQK